MKTRVSPEHHRRITVASPGRPILPASGAKEGGVAHEILVEAPVLVVRRELERLGSLAPHPDGYRLDLPFRAEPAQIAHAERTLARRGAAPDLRRAPVSVRLTANVCAGYWRLGFERVVRVGPVSVCMSDAQAHLCDRLIVELARRMDARRPVSA